MSKTDRQQDLVAAEDRELSRDDLFEILSNRRRRFVLHYLRRADDEPAELSDVVDQVAAWEHGVEVDELSYDDRKSVHISLYQHHGPKLDEAGIIDYDKRAGLLELTADPEDIDVYLDAAGDPGIPWEVVLPVASIGVGLVVLVGSLGVVPGGVPDVAWAVFAAGTFAASSFAFLYDTRYRRGSDSPGPPPEIASE